MLIDRCAYLNRADCDNNLIFMPFSASSADRQFFFEQFALTQQDLEKYLSAALSAGGDYADLYFEYLTSSSISVDESLVKSATQGVTAGCGIRVISGDRTGYAHTDNLAPDRILHAAKTAALIASAPAKNDVAGFKETESSRNLYPVASSGVDTELSAKLEMVMRADRAARAYDSRIKQVRGVYVDEVRRILVVGSDGTLATDTQPMSRMSVYTIAKSS